MSAQLQNGAVRRGSHFAMECAPCGVRVFGYANATQAAQRYDEHSKTQPHTEAVAARTEQARIDYEQRQERRRTGAA